MKKLLTSLLCVMMVVCFMPSMAWANDNADVGTALPTENEAGVVVLDKDYKVASLKQNGKYDLQGHTLTITGTTAICPGNGETLEVYDSSVSGGNRGGTLNFESKVYTTLADINPQAGGTVTVSNINIISPNSVFYPQGNAAAVNVTNCSVTAGCYCVGTNAGSGQNHGVIITLKDSAFVSNSADKDNCTIMINVSGTLNIDNCSVTGDRQAVLVRAGNATIKNSTITTTGSYEYGAKEDYEANNWGNGNNLPVGGLIVGNKNNTAYAADANVSLIDTKVSSENKAHAALYVHANNTYKSNIDISGQETVINGSVVKKNDEQAAISITGGTFTDTEGIEDYIAPGMAVDEEGKVVINTETAFASVNGVGYTTLQDAIDAAQPGDVVTLLKDIDTGNNNAGNTQGVFTITKNITIDGANHKISANEQFNVTTSDTGSKLSASMFNIENGAEVTFRNLTIDGNGKAKHGLNIYTRDRDKNMSSVKVENVTIQNCNGYGIVCNGSKLTVDGITTTGNGWGGINVDTRIGGYPEAELVFNGGTINEVNSIYFENTVKSKDEINTANIVKGTINNGTFKGAVHVQDKTDGTDVGGVILTIKGGTYEKGIENQYLAPGLIVNSNGTVTTPYIPPTPTTQKPVIEPNTDVTTSLSADGTTLTIKANEGYEITDVTVNGVSKGAVDKLTGLKTGDKVVIKTQKVEKPDDNAVLIEAVKSFKLVARSANAKAPSGKKAIKVTWFAKDGSELNFDGYEIYRSTKKNSGYGTKPIYKTTKSLQYFNTSAKKGTRYYYKVRGYKMIGGEKVYTPYSLKAIRTAK